MTTASAPVWEDKRTEETRRVEDFLRNAGFQQANAYRYNLASIRVRVIDSRFEGLSIEKRDAIVEPFLDQLPEETQQDIISLFTFAPSEIILNKKPTREFMLNMEFDEPSLSML